MYTHSHARTRTHALTPNLLSPPSDGCGHHLGQRDRDPLSMSYHVLIFPSPCLHVFPQPALKATEGMSASHQRRTGWLRPQKLAEDATAAEENGRNPNIERKEEEGPDAGWIILTEPSENKRREKIFPLQENWGTQKIVIAFASFVFVTVSAAVGFYKM